MTLAFHRHNGDQIVQGQTFFWAEQKSNDFRSLDSERTIAILPIAAIGQHGPHLPVMTDTVIAVSMLALPRDRLPEDLRVLVLPIQATGKSNEHLLSPGTLSLTAETLSRVLLEIVESVYRAGLRKIVLANSDGGNVPVLATRRMLQRTKDERPRSTKSMASLHSFVI
jgi:creatinine amidohydrolase